MKNILLLAMMATSTLGGCATVPDATMQYYLPRAVAMVTVTQSADCDASKVRIFTATSATATVLYSSDTNRPQTFRLKAANGALADLEGNFTFTDDGRLKGVSTSTTGQGEAILKSAISLASTLISFGVAGGKPQPSADCQTIASWGGGKPVTLTYTARIQDPFNAAGATIVPDAGSAALYQKLKGVLPVLALNMDPKEKVEFQPPVLWAGKSDDLKLTLGKTGRSQLVLTAEGKDVWRQDIIVPTSGTFDVPIAKAATFGKSTFSLALSDAGTITAAGYTKTAGAAGAANVGGALATAFKPKTDTEQAAEVKAQADLIAQQQRLVRCQANPAACS